MLLALNTPQVVAMTALIALGIVVLPGILLVILRPSSLKPAEAAAPAKAAPQDLEPPVTVAPLRPVSSPAVQLLQSIHDDLVREAEPGPAPEIFNSMAGDEEWVDLRVIERASQELRVGTAKPYIPTVPSRLVTQRYPFSFGVQACEDGPDDLVVRWVYRPRVTINHEHGMLEEAWIYVEGRSQDVPKELWRSACLDFCSRVVHLKQGERTTNASAHRLLQSVPDGFPLPLHERRGLEDTLFLTPHSTLEVGVSAYEEFRGTGAPRLTVGAVLVLTMQMATPLLKPQYRLS